jgi:hypothetical protein
MGGLDHREDVHPLNLVLVNIFLHHETHDCPAAGEKIGRPLTHPVKYNLHKG